MISETQAVLKQDTRAQLEPQVVVRKRNGRIATFESSRIQTALEKAFKADKALQELSEELQRETLRLTEAVVREIFSRLAGHGEIGIEDVQDVVEMQLMQAGHYSVARRYILYREERARSRLIRGMLDDGALAEEETQPQLVVTDKRDGSFKPLQWESIKRRLISACKGLASCNASELIDEVSRTLYNFMRQDEVDKALVLAARTRIEKDPAYATVAARLLLHIVYTEVFGSKDVTESLNTVYRENFKHFIKKGIDNDRLSKDLLDFDIEKLAAALEPERDNLFLYMGLQTVYDRYLLHVDKRRIETPQYFWMRVAMGLSVNEPEKEKRAVEFYNMLSSFRFVSSTPTLFNSGTLHPQLSSCYLSTIDDDLEHIFKVVSDNAKLSKWAGGLGNDWTNVRATGAQIKGTNGESQGVIPFLKVANDTAVAVNQGGKRKGAVCAYLETWHIEIEEFLELRKNTGDERRRTHDMNTANWVPDLFMKRIAENGVWTLFSPNEVSDLHDLYGKEFEKRYTEYEQMAQDGKIRQYKQVPAIELWRKMLSMLFETGHPWITFKDPSNVRSPQDHAGVVHSSNLCTEILLNTSAQETAVCNLGSVNLKAHMKGTELDTEMIKETVSTAVRMLDNVIDINFYPTSEAHNSNSKHRPVGLGLMGFQDALYVKRVPYESQEAIDFADSSMEQISYHAILASTELAKERGTYTSYKGSKWDRGMLPIDTIDSLEQERGGYIEVDRSTKLDWNIVRQAIKENGMRNSNVMAIAPTATIANIAGVTQSIEPTYRNLYVKSNLSGEFTIINPYLVDDLKKHGLWDTEMIDDLKYYDGSLLEIERIPEDLKDLYRTAFEINQDALIECASRRQKWIDMGQSLNLYIDTPSGKRLNDMYMNAWKSGLKTTYYLRSLGATQIEKSSVDINKRGLQPRWMKSKSASSEVQVQREAAAVCDPNNPDCEACQ